LSFIKLEEVFEIHTKMAVDAEATEPATTALALGIGVTRTIGSGADEKASELPRRVLDLARDPISRPAFASLQLLGRLRWCRCMMMRAPMARSSQFQVEFLPQFSVYDKRQRRVSRILHFLFALSFLLSPKTHSLLMILLLYVLSIPLPNSKASPPQSDRLHPHTEALKECEEEEGK
jgi:hypothetical protein